MKRIPLLAVLPVLLLALAAGEVLGQPTYTDAQMLASLQSDSLLAPDTLVARIDYELALIRTHTREMSDIHVSCVSPIPGSVVVEMTPEALSDFLAGQHAAMNQLNAELGMAEYYTFLDYVILYFFLPYNPVWA
jgi:hypothetical protein